MLKDLYIGKQGENKVIGLLNDAKIKATESLDKDTRKFYDIIGVFENAGASKEFYVEVKTDLYASRSGNIAIEVYNPKSGVPSGLTVTKAHLWAHIVNGEVWVTTVEALTNFTKDTSPFKIVSSGGDDNATILLYQIDTILPVIFQRIDHITDVERFIVIGNLLKCL